MADNSEGRKDDEAKKDDDGAPEDGERREGAAGAAEADKPDASPDDEDEPTLLEDCDSLIDDIEAAQKRIKGPSDLFVKNAGGGKVAQAVRDALADTVLVLVRELGALVADMAHGFEKMAARMDGVEDEVGRQRVELRTFVSGSVLMYAVVLAQLVAARGEVDDEMRRLAQEILRTMGSIQAAPPPADGQGAPVAAVAPPDGEPAAQAESPA